LGWGHYNPNNDSNAECRYAKLQSLGYFREDPIEFLFVKKVAQNMFTLWLLFILVNVLQFHQN